MTYWKKIKKQVLFCVFLCFSYNFYFLCLLPEVKRGYLWYLDVLLAVCGLFYGGAGYLVHRRQQADKREYLKYDTVISQRFAEVENYDIAEHDVRVLNEQLEEQMEQNQDLQDYVAKWFHEVKAPLSASLLMARKIEDAKQRYLMQEQLERINVQLNCALLGCKVQGSLFDLQIKPVSLLECVKTSVHNNQFFLIRNHFEIEMDVEDVKVYTDKSWFVYILDQLLGNAVKYVMQTASLKLWSVRKGESVCLFVEDHGEGIRAEDIRRIFEKGYTGSSHHNGRYKSTGMGLYMTAKIAKRLGHEISVESEPMEFTRFAILARPSEGFAKAEPQVKL